MRKKPSAHEIWMEEMGAAERLVDETMKRVRWDASLGNLKRYDEALKALLALEKRKP